MVEVALAQVEAAAADKGMLVCGVYHANELFKDTNVDVFSQKVADKIADVADGARSVILATIDNKRLGLYAETHALVVSQNIEGMWEIQMRSNLKVENSKF